MDSRLCLVLLYVFGGVTIESTSHRHRHHNNPTRRVPNHLADLKDHILHGYDSSVKPDQKVIVQLGWTLLDVHLCAHKQVRTNILVIYDTKYPDFCTGRIMISL